MFYKDGENYFLPSFIGSWIFEMSHQFELVGLISIQSEKKLEKFDYQIVSSKRIMFFSIEKKKNIFNQLKKLPLKDFKTIQNLEFNFLIIRGITPLQYFIHRKFNFISQKFLLVGSVVDSRPKIKFTKIGLLLYFLFWKRILELKLISLTASVYANSPKIIEELHLKLSIKSSFIPTNSLRLKDFSKKKKMNLGEPLKLLFCGRVTAEKGIEELLVALALLLKETIKIELIIVGFAQKEYLIHLNNLIKQLNIEGSVFFRGFVPFGENLFAIYKEADVFVLPSWHEGFPHSIWEAACNYLPIITTKVGGIPGLLDTSLVNFIEVQDSKSIKNAILECINNPSEKLKKSDLMYEYAKKYSIENCVQILKREIEKG
jgi:glycosyltransferase involved in cell wall biosynthesis